jgi:exopolysaccharide production protein ExoQ
MPPSLATLLCFAFVIWLFLTEGRRSGGMSRVLWIPLVWGLILASRPVSFWFGGGGKVSFDEYLEGSPVDRAAYLALLVVGLHVLWKRGLTLSSVAQRNTALFAFVLFWGISTIWSEYPFVAFKRWIKEIGTITMALIILSEERPVDAIRAVMLRSAYVLIPFSTLLIKYYPGLGRNFNHWTWEYMYVGVTQNKNQLGSGVFITSIFVVWYLFDRIKPPYQAVKWKEHFHLLLVLTMAAWLLHIANSATSLVCFVLGITLLVLFRFPIVRQQFPRLEVYLIGIPLLLAGLDLLLGLKDMALATIGRNSTLTERTYIWSAISELDLNPILGSGFYSFWLSSSAQTVLETYRGINQAHNGYLEVFLNGGIVGGLLLLIFLVSTERKIKFRLVSADSSFGQIAFVIFVTGLLHNLTEATFSRFSFSWLVFLLISMNPPRAEEAAISNSESSRDDFSDITCDPAPRPAM